MIRSVRPGDLPAVLALIRELAEYEGEPDAVEADEADLRAAFFGKDPQAFAHVAEQDERVVGVAVWYVTFSTWTGRHGIHLVDLVVTADARRDGHGRALFAELARLCVERGYRRLDWETANVLLDGGGGPDRPGPHGFYRRQGGRPRPDWTSWRLEGEALLTAADAAGRAGILEP
ncbi:GNAT family N-acetyltransferase [Jatrophihabitans endophyticus]|uniref:GNAT family N-acetyltransferase n=1 Tax=Jatrophihabitans endophyticus TaxID=1206085 RepID=UPI0019F1463C|nr:GNAT family N-acetyltransferase [Jatrophihabitans endophyticus]MBE7188436.1 GNAT family N-acetyltransferase [Jatrophihabitans endophyticus]